MPPEGEDDAAPADVPVVTCDVCGASEPKYRCPCCSKRTCSVGCVKAHKESTGCTGKRNRTAFTGRGQFNDAVLVSDYRFLEEIKLAEDVAKRSKPPAPQRELPRFLQTLVYQASQRHVELHILAPGMERRKANTTRYDARRRLLSWRVEWNFLAAGCRAVNVRASEEISLSSLLHAHLTPAPGSSLKPELQRYVGEGGLKEGLLLALKKERTPANAPVYYRIESSATLAGALRKKLLVEFPVFLVLLEEDIVANSFVFVEND